MILTIRVDGGLAQFPGLTRPITVDTAVLPHVAAHELEALVAESTFFSLPAAVGGAGEGRPTTWITIQDGTRSHTIRTPEPSPDPVLARLIAGVLRTARR